VRTKKKLLSILYIYIFCKIDNVLALLHSILHRLPSTTAFVVDAADDKIGTVNHFTVANLDGRFRMCHRCSVGDLYVGVIVVKVFFVIKILCRRITPKEFFDENIAEPQLVQKLYELTRNMSEADLSVLISTAERLNDK